MRFLLTITGAASLLAAQSPPPVREPRPPVVAADLKSEPTPVDKAAPSLRPSSTTPPARAPRRADPAAPVPPTPLAPAGFVLFDAPGDGAQWIATDDWKARIDGRGVAFAPCLGADADGSARIELSLLSVSVGGEFLPLASTEPRRSGQRVELDHTTVVERYDVLPTGLEQSFVLPRLDRRGEVVVDLQLRTALATATNGNVVTCTNADGGVRIHDAVAIDARGARCPLPMVVEPGRLRIRVPTTFVATAVLPLVIDPTISPIVPIADTVRLERPDIAYDPSLGEYFAIWQRDFSAVDRDVYAWRLDAGMQSVGPLQAIDVSFASWEYARVANCDLADNFLVVAQVSAGGTPWIGARLWSPTVVGLQFVVEQAGLPGHLVGAKLFPDVGGDPSPTGPVYYTVVWERVWSTVDHDVHMKQVDTTGALRSQAPTLLDNSSANTSHPRIGKSDGRNAGPGSTSQFWPVVWQRTFSAIDEDVYGTCVAWDGQPLATGPFAVSIHSGDERDPVASSPTEEVAGARHMLFAWARHDAATDWDIVAAYHAADGWQRGVLNVNLADSLPAFAALAQWNAAADCDGLRFGVGYTEDFVGTTLWDTHVSLLRWDDTTSSLVVDEPRVWFGQTYGQEDHTAIVAQGSAGGPSTYYGVAYDLIDGTGLSGICAHPYTGYADQPLPSTRLTGCGGLGITMNDLPVLGSTITVTQSDSGPLTGFVFGFPISAPLGFCPGCELGVDGFFTPNPMVWTVPPVAAYVGIELSVQAFSLNAGPCLGQIALSNTIDFRLL